LYLNTNLAALSGIQALESNTTMQNSTLQQIATGNRITSAASDPAGLAISELMQSQISGLNQAGSNAQNGISLLQTADGALSSIDTILQSMNSLAAEAAGGTQNSGDLKDLQAEMNQYAQEISAISNTTQFNGISLLNGGFTNQAVQTGIAQGQSLTLSIGAMDAYSLGLSSRSFGVSSTGTQTLGLTSAGTDITGAGLNTSDTIALQNSTTYATVTSSGGVLSGAVISGNYDGASSVTYTIGTVTVDTTTGSTTIDITGSNGYSGSTVIASSATSFNFYDGTSNSTFTLNTVGTLSSSDKGDTITANAASVTFYLTDSGATVSNSSVTVSGYTAISDLTNGTNISLGTYGNISFTTSNSTVSGFTSLASFQHDSYAVSATTNGFALSNSEIDLTGAGLSAGTATLAANAGTAATYTESGGVLAAATVTGTVNASSAITYTVQGVTFSGTSTTITFSYSVGTNSYTVSTTVASTTGVTLVLSDTTTGNNLTIVASGTFTATDVGDKVTATPADVSFTLNQSGSTIATATVTGGTELSALKGGFLSFGTYGSFVLPSGTTTTGFASLATLGATATTATTTEFTVTAATTGNAYSSALTYSVSGAAATDPSSPNFGVNNYATVTNGPSISTQNDAQDALATIGTAINTVDTQRAQIGAWMNQLSFAQTNSGTAATNLQDANASYLNANMAQVTSQFVQQNTLVQADVGILAQADQLPAALLKLIP